MMILKIAALLVLHFIYQSCEGIPTKENSSSKSQLITVDMAVDYNNEDVPDYMKNALANVTLMDDKLTNKHGDTLGIPRLRKAIASFYSRLINRTLNWENEVIATTAGREAMFLAVRAFTSIGDEWIIIEPFYPKYKLHVQFANGVPRFTNLKPTKTDGNLSASDWQLDREEMASLINSKTRGIIFNNPNNPTGKVYELSDLEFIANLAKEHDLLVISDEVHEFTTDNTIRMATLPGMFERTVTIGSASKAFSAPGWRAGWAYGPAELIGEMEKIHAGIVGFLNMPIQAALSLIFEYEDKNFDSSLRYLTKNLASLKRQRNFIVQAFLDAGMQPIVPQGGYCMLASWPKLQTNSDITKSSNFDDWMSTTIGIKTLDAGTYYSTEHRHLGAGQLRFCYHKSKKTLRMAAENLIKLKSY